MDKTADRYSVNADMSHDDVRLKKDERSRNLSAFEEPDNVEGSKKDKPAGSCSFNADRSGDDVRLEEDKRSENLSACNAPDNVKGINEKESIE